MAHEIEAAAVDSLGAIRSRSSHTLAVGAPCPNCGAVLAGPWCHACGQSAEDFHRSILRLTREAIDGLFDLDGRLWLTLPDLVLRPARLTRSYLDGHRVGQIPPFRLFLIVVVLVFLVGGLGAQKPQRANVDLTLDLGGQRTVFKTEPDMQSVLKDEMAAGRNKGDAWIVARAQAAARDPQRFAAAMTTWAQRLAIFTLPLSAALLGLTFFWRREIYLFDHLIFSMHSLSFQGLLISAVMLGGLATDWSMLGLVAAPTHLFVHLRGTYRIGIFGALWRMIVLFLVSLLALAFAVGGLVMIGLYEVGQ
jgi:hypothetical protein